MRRAHGFTLVELMVVVSITAVLASLAVISMRKSRTESDVDALANAVRTSFIQARRRAVATRQVYMVDLRPGQVRWCQVDPASVSTAATLVTTQTQCPPANTTLEKGGVVQAGSDATITSYALVADITIPNVTAVTATKVTVPAAGQPLYFGPLGICDSVYANAANASPVGLAGFTAYIKPKSSGSDAAFKRRRVVIFGISARPRIIDNW